MKKFLIVVIAFTFCYLNSNSATKYSHGNPTNEEQFILELINRARANPQEEAQRVVNYQDSYIQSEIAKIGKQLIISQFSTYPKRPPLAFNAQINIAAKGHSQDMSDNNFQDHVGSNGDDLAKRIDKCGYTNWMGLGENIFAASTGPEYAHIGFLVDWGADNQAKLGHRQNILNFSGSIFTEIGICGLVAPYKSASGPYVCTEDFGFKADHFVLGVVYNDKNGNKFYDPGEGLPNIAITLSSGNYEAVTTSSGGYAIPINGLSGSVTIKAEGAGLGGIITQSFSANFENVKVDFTSSLAGAVSLAFPNNSATMDSTNIPFKWYKSNKATSYLFELSDDQDFNNIMISKEMTDTTITPDQKIFKNGTEYFWRVRGKSSNGDGDYSPVYKFTIFVAPKSPDLIFPEDYSRLKTSDVKFIWNKNKGTIKYYKFELWEQFGDNPIVADSTLTDTFKIVKNLQYNITYIWKVAALGVDFWGNYSAENKFEIIQVPQKITLTAPVDNFNAIYTKVIKFDWVAPSGSVTKYKIEIAKDSLFTKMFLLDSTLKTNTRSINNTPLGNYFWRITAANDNGWGITGDIRRFNVTNSSVEFDNEDASILIYPNPTNSIVTIDNKLGSLAFESIQLFDLSGKLVSPSNIDFNNKFPFGKTPNENILELDLSFLPQGQYVLLIKTDKNLISKKITLVK